MVGEVAELHTPEPVPLESGTWKQNFEFTSVECHLTDLESLVFLIPIKCWLSVLFFPFFFPYYLPFTNALCVGKILKLPSLQPHPTYLKQVCVVASVWWLRSWPLWLLSVLSSRLHPTRGLPSLYNSTHWLKSLFKAVSSRRAEPYLFFDS